MEDNEDNQNEAAQDKNKYFAAKSKAGCVEVLEDKISHWESALSTSGIIDKMQRSWSYYHGYFDQNSFSNDTHKINSAGEQGELLKFPVNHYRNIATHMLNMTTANRPSMQARSLNTDYKSLSQTLLANGLLDYYMREKALEDITKQATEYSIVLSEGWIKAEWDSTSGDTYGFNEETQSYIYNGDLKFRALTPLEVIRDVYKTDSDQMDWLIIKSYKNRFDLIAKYPDFEKEILALQTKESENMFKLGFMSAGESDDVPVYEFFHNRTDAVRDGRYIMFLTADIVPIDLPLPYRFIPVFPIMPSRSLGTPFGYSIMFDLLPIQEAINMLNSVILTNQNAFGVQNVMSPRGSDINFTQLSGGLNFIEYNPGMGEPKALNLTQTPAEIFNMLNKLESTMETISGVNQVTRGDPSASLRSGSALALIQAQAVQFASGLQQSYVRLVESVGTAVIKILQDFAEAPRVAAIVGKANRTYLKEFTGKDLTSVSRVIVDITNPISRTTAGRLQMATDLIQYQLIKTPEHYFTIMNTGSLDVMTQGAQQELLLVQSENEDMSEGKEVSVIAIDSHLMHIKEHKSLLYDTELRRDPNITALVLGHINEHINQLKSVDPQLLQQLGEQPMQPEQVAPPPGEAPPNKAEGEQMNQGASLSAPPPTGAEEATSIAQPSMPTPAGSPELPITAAEGMSKITG